jgi:hypothetical protein
MGLLVTNAGEKTLLEWALKSAGGALKLKLFKNNATISPTTVAGDLTEADFNGYSARTLARASWNAPSTNGDGKAEIRYSADQTYDFASAQSIYGYYLTDSSDVLIAVEKFTAVRNQVIGDQYVIQPGLTITTSGTGAVVTNVGELTLLDWAIRSTGENVVLRLFKTSVVPSATSVRTDFTESDFTSYTTRTLTRANWNAAATQGDGSAQIAYNADQDYTPGSDQTLWGYMYCKADGTLLWAEKYATVRNLVTSDPFTIQPRFSLVSEA